MTGTHAYDMIAAYAETDAGITEGLMHMIAATVLMKSGLTEVTFSPDDLNDTHRDYQMHVTIDGLITTVRITPRDQPEASLAVQDEDTTDSRPQAEHVEHDRPLWFMHDSFGLREANSAEQARRMVSRSVDPIASVRNRMCAHPECPDSKCTREVTS